MEDKYAVVGIVCALLIGLILGLFLMPIFQTVQAPASHRTIVNATSIKDTTVNFYLKPTLVRVDKPEWCKGLDFQATVGKSYPQTTWVWTRYGDVEVAMTIWGPGDDGVTCLVEFATLAGNPFSINCGGQQFNLQTGYYCTTVKVIEGA